MIDKSNSFLTLAELRQSDRKFDATRPIAEEALERIVSAGRLAPSACNAQPWHFVVVTEKQLCSEVGKGLNHLGMNKFCLNAVAYIVIVKESANLTSTIGAKWKNKDFSSIDIGIATSYLTLAAASEEIGSCIIGWFNENKIKELLNIPSNKRIELVIALGYSLENNRRKKRKAYNSVISFNEYD